MGDDGVIESTTTPEWLDKSFLTTVMRDVEKDDALSVKDSLITYAVSKGDNYLSQMLRVHVKFTRGNGTTDQRYIIVKCLPVGEYMKQMMMQGGTFRREIYTFHHAFPAMYQLVKEKTSRDFASVACLAFPSPQPYTLILEDLKELGYRMADRRAQLDLEHCKVALRTLARFHGISAALYKMDPSFIDAYKETVFSEETRDTAKAIIYPSLKDLSGLVANWPGYERFGEKLRLVSQTFIDRMIELLKPRPGKLRVLNHGDIWTNNILFKYSENTGEITGAKLVDFQLCRFASPALDIQFFFSTTPQREVRINHWDDMLRVYHEALSDTLTCLGCEEDAMSFQELQEEMVYCGFNALLSACTILVVILADPDDAMDLSEVNPDEPKHVNGMAKAQNGALYQSVFKELLLEYEQKGIL